MPHSDRRFDDTVKRWILSRIPLGSAVLDIGAGSGKWVDLLGGAYHMVALEICEEYITRYDLPGRYKATVCNDARNIQTDHLQGYGLVILGDVLEHLTPLEAMVLLDKIRTAKVPALVVVPYRYHQDGTDENPHEKHEQDDLTHEIFMQRFGVLSPVPLASEAFGAVWLFNTPDCFKYVETREITKKELEGVSLAIATPHPGVVHTCYMTSMCETIDAFGRIDVPVALLLSSGALLPTVRNGLVKDFLSSPSNFTHLLMVDSDQGWQAQDLIRLLYKSVSLNKEVIGYASIKKSDRPDWAVNFKDLLEGGQHAGTIEEDGTIEVGSIGTGFLIIARTALEKMVAAYPELALLTVNENKLEKQPNHFALFRCLVDDEGREWSEDLSFCIRWRRIGGQVWVDPTGDLAHVGYKTYRGSLMLGIRPNQGGE